MKNLNFIIAKTNKILKEDIISYNITSKDYVYYGKKNNYPYFLYDLYQNSPLLQGIIDSIKDYTIGEGITNTNKVNARGETLQDIIEKLVFDYILYGGFAINIIKSKIGTITEIYHIDFKKVRFNEEETKAFISNNWTKYASKNIELPTYEPLENQASSVLYYKGKRSNETYPIPMYMSSIKSILNLINVDEYHSSSISNDFSPSVMLSFKEGKPTIEEQNEIEQAINSKWSGASNAGKLLLTFSDGADTAPELKTIEQSDWSDRYLSLIQASKENIYTSFRISPILVGGMQQSTGFNSIEYKSAFVLYNKTTIKPIQNQIENLFNTYLSDFTFTFISFDTNGFYNINNN